MLHTYDVVFYRRLPNSYGQEYPVMLARFRVGECEAGDQALTTAADRFIKQMKVADWRDLAHEVTVDTVT